MCGLIGIIGIPYFGMDIRGLLERIAHRGPDAAGIFESDDNQHVKMGHRRLSIIDLSEAANQPFHKGDQWRDLQVSKPRRRAPLTC